MALTNRLYLFLPKKYINNSLRATKIYIDLKIRKIYILAV